MATIKLFHKLSEKFIQLPKGKKKLLKYIFELSEDKNIDYRIHFLFPEEIPSIIFEAFEKEILNKIGKLQDIKEIIIDKKLKIT